VVIFVEITKDKLIDLVKSSTIRTLSSRPKKMYKYALGAIFFNIVNGKHLQNGQSVNVAIAEDILNNPKQATRKYNIDSIKGHVQRCFNLAHFKRPYQEETIDKVIAFFRKRLDELSNKKTLFMASELEEIINIQNFYQHTNHHIKSHHWIEFELGRGLIPTIPEFIAYGDVINLWNLLLEKHSIYKEAEEEISSPENYLEFHKSSFIRKLKYTIITLNRSCVISAITFAESYLFYLFYNFKNEKVAIDKEKVRSLYERNEKTIQDTEIVEK
jgi:hypothetical protein